MDINIDDLSSIDIAELLAEHMAGMAELSPPESIHALDIEKLKQPEITFWSARIEDQLAGCGALKEISPDHGEVKSMRTASQFKRQGVANNLLAVILATAKSRGYKRVSLETGSMAGFAPARTLYEKHGFAYCPPFGDYQLDPNSVFMTKEIL